MKNKKSIGPLIIVSITCVIIGCIFFFKGYASNIDQKENKNDIPYADYVGDNSAVLSIVSHMTFPKGYEYDHIELDTQKEPYGLTVILTGESSIDYDLFSSNADLAFEHIGNLGSVTFINKETGEVIALASKGTYLPTETVTETNLQEENGTTYVPESPVINLPYDGIDSNDTVEYIYNIDAPPDESYILRDMAMGFYKGYINGDIKMVESSISEASSISPDVFAGDPDKVSFLGIVDADKVVSGEGDTLYIGFEDKNLDEGTKKFIELNVAKEGENWKVLSYGITIEN